MQILSSSQIRAWDEFTIQHEPIASIDLMERAAANCFEWILEHYDGRSFSIFCAKGNNGGDGLAIARMLSSNHDVKVYILEFGHLGTEDFQTNLARLHQTGVSIKFISTNETIPEIGEDVIIDALFGSGLNRPLEGLTAELVNHINYTGCEVVSIDIPSGLSADNSSKGNVAVKADHTLSFQCYKPAFLVAENEPYTGDIHILDIGLHPAYLEGLKPDYLFLDHSVAKELYVPRKSFSHKGSYGHVLLCAGSFGKIGAAILSATSCLRAGAGLLTVHLPACGYGIMQTAVPEAMVSVDENDKTISSLPDGIDKYDCIAIGPGIGTETTTVEFIQQLTGSYRKPLVIDADGLNIIAREKSVLDHLPENSILTPHPKEFERIFGGADDFEKIHLAKTMSEKYRIVIVLKGHHTLIASPGGAYFNTTGNPGMATGGTGDVLTGIIAGLVAQKYSPEDAAKLGVYLHGLAADIAVELLSQESLIASDITVHLGNAFLQLQQTDE